MLVRRLTCGRAVGDGPQPVEVDLGGDPLGYVLDARPCSLLLVGRHQTQMTLSDLHAGVVLDGADHFDIRVMLDHRAQLGFMSAATEIVEDDAGNADVRIERLIP